MGIAGPDVDHETFLVRGPEVNKTTFDTVHCRKNGEQKGPRQNGPRSSNAPGKLTGNLDQAPLVIGGTSRNLVPGRIYDGASGIEL